MDISPFRIITLLVLGLALASGAQERTIWQIGEFDNSYEEFAIPHDFKAYPRTFPKDITFRPGKDDASIEWPFIHPGPGDAWAGNRIHPFAIIFDLAEAPEGLFTLHIDLVDTHAGGPPEYEITVNGKSGRFSLPRGAGDQSLGDASKGKEHVIDLPLPASFFRKGENKLVLGCVTGSWVLYDALRLTQDPEGKPPAAGIERLSLSPTILFVCRGDRLKQVIELSAECSPGTPELRAELRVGGKTQEFALKPDLLGGVKQEVYVDEVSLPTQVEAAVTIGLEKKTASFELRPQKHWKVYVQPSAHVDIGYTDWQERVIVRHNENMSLALDLCRKYPEFKWNTEAAWVEDNYLSMMPGERKSEFIQRAKEGRIGCQAIYGNMLTGICSHESFIRDLYYAHSVAKKHGIPYDIAMSSDVPTQVWTMPTKLVGAGIRYFSAGLNLTRGDSFNKLFGKSPFYWEGPDGSRVLTWLSPGYAYATNLGLAHDIEHARQGIEGFLKGYDREDYPFDAVLAFGGFSDNVPLSPLLAPVAEEWNRKYAYPQVILCRGPEFFAYIEAGFPERIPTIQGDGGVYWEDGAGSSAVETADVRLAKETLASAEKLHAFNWVFGRADYPATEIDLAWKNAILYDEHTWGAHCSINQPESEQTIHQWEYKADFARKAAASAERILQRALGGLTGLVSVSEPSIVVFNPLSQPASGLVHVERDGKLLDFWADDVPSVGYKVVPATGTHMNGDTGTSPSEDASHIPSPPAGEAQGEGPSVPSPLEGEGQGEGENLLENRFYRLEFDPATGAVKSLLDKELGREVVDPKAPYGINQYIYISGQGKEAKDVTGISSVRIGSEKRPYDRAIRIEGAAYKTPRWTSEIVLYDKVKRIDFVNTLQKEETYDKEAGYFAFPFALDKPEFYVEIPDGVMRPKQDMLPGACMQWYCAQDFVAAADDKCAVVWTPIDSPLFTIGDINRETFQSPLPIENGHLYAYVFNNYWFTNYKASQGGEMVFRFSMTSMGRYDPVEASRFGQSVRNPLLAAVVGAGSPRPPLGRGDPAPTSLCMVTPANVVIQAVKKAEFGDGLIVRLREIAGRTTDAVLSLPQGRFKGAWSCSLVEDPQSELDLSGGKVRVSVPASGLATVLLK